jgi:hypothetical protein
MKFKLTFLLQTLVLSVSMMILSIGSVFAQLPCPAGCSGPNCEFCNDPSTVPLDGGVVSILVAGVLIGVVMMYKRNQLYKQNQ